MVSEASAKINVLGMSCNHCSSRVEKVVGGLEGVITANVSLEEKSLIVKFNSDKLSIDKIIDAVNKLGYKASKN